jgi:hypothetical protein
MSDDNASETSEPQDPGLDPSQVQYLRQRLESEQNLPLGVIAGTVASLAGAGVWAGVTIATNYQIGFMAIGIGFLVGFGVRSFGKGVSNTFGIVSAAFSILGCALGNLLTASAMVAAQEDIPFLSLIAQLNLELIQELMVAFFQPMDLLFYGIAIYYGYKLAFRQLTDQDLKQMLSAGG